MIHLKRMPAQKLGRFPICSRFVPHMLRACCLKYIYTINHKKKIAFVLPKIIYT